MRDDGQRWGVGRREGKLGIRFIVRESEVNREKRASVVVTPSICAPSHNPRNQFCPARLRPSV